MSGNHENDTGTERPGHMDLPFLVSNECRRRTTPRHQARDRHWLSQVPVARGGSPEIEAITAGVAVSRSDRLDAAAGGPDDGARILAAVFIEHPDPTGKRWQLVLDLLLEAGRRDCIST
jgi:hypothetical protein